MWRKGNMKSALKVCCTPNPACVGNLEGHWNAGRVQLINALLYFRLASYADFDQARHRWIREHVNNIHRNCLIRRKAQRKLMHHQLMLYRFIHPQTSRPLDLRTRF